MYTHALIILEELIWDCFLIKGIIKKVPYRYETWGTAIDLIYCICN